MIEIAHERGVPELPSLSLRWWLEPAVAAFGVVFAGALLVGLLQGTRHFYGDSGEYWSLAASFTQHGHFSLLNFESTLRGYALPLIIYALKTFAGGVHWSQSSVATLFNALMFALIGAVLAPRLAEVAWPERRWGFRRRITLTTLLIIFWSGDLNYPLTDFPGLAMALLTLVAVAQPDASGWMLVAGIAGGLAVDLRPAYLLLVPMLAVIVGLAWFDQRGTRHASLPRRALCVGLLVVGFAVVSLPQSLSSHRHLNTWSFVPGATASLNSWRLAVGMIYQRSDTYEGPEGPSAIVYDDDAGRRLLEQQPEGEIKSTSQYIGLILSHPAVMTDLLARHIINGLDARYNTVYVEHRDSGGRIWLRLVGFLLVFLALVRLLWPAARRGLGSSRWRYLIALSLCCLTSVTTAIETRYMLPVYLLTYILVLMPGWPNPIGSAGVGVRRLRTLVPLATAYLAFMAAVWHVVGGANGHVVFQITPP